MPYRNPEHGRSRRQAEAESFFMSDTQGNTPSGHSAAGQETPGPGISAAASGYGDRVYRSVTGFAAGVLLIALTVWLCGDAVVRGHDRTPWYGAAVLLLTVPVFLAFTVLPVVRANQDRLYVRNPFRTITVPWSRVESIRAALSVELRADEKTYQVWAIPVSLRQRKKAGRRAMIAQGDRSVVQGSGGQGSRFPIGGPGLRSRAAGVPNSGGDELPRATADRSVDELRELASEAQDRPTATGQVTVVWAWWIIAPALLGAVGVAVLAITG
jgi:hypothetical protein